MPDKPKMGKFIYALSASAAAACTALVACGPIDDVHDTKNLAQKMADTTGHTDLNLGNSIEPSRQAIGKKARDDAFAALMDKNLNPDFKRKAVAAVSFVYGFEFQAWTGIAPDTEDRRQQYFDSAMEEILWRTCFLLDNKDVLVDDQGNLSFNLPMNSQNRLAMAALGAALHRVNYINRIEPVSLFDLLKDGVETWSKYRSRQIDPKAVTGYREKVARYIKQVDVLLSMRLEGLIMVSIGSLANLADKDTDFFSAQLRVLFGLTEKAPTINAFDNNWFELKFDEEAMDQAKTTLDVLKNAKIPVSVNSRILSAARKLKLDTTKMQGFGVEADQASATLAKLRDVVNQIDQYPRFDVKAPYGTPASNGEARPKAKRPAKPLGSPHATGEH